MNIPTKYIITTAEQSQQIDACTTEKFGIDGFTLMEVAGSSAAKILLAYFEPHKNGLVLCGKGNNGGDALVVARYLAQHDYKMHIAFVGGADDLSTSAEKNYKLLQAIQKDDERADISFITNWGDFNHDLTPDFIIDGMLGTGLDSELRGDFVDAVRWVNKQNSAIFAMDIPTGLHADSGTIMGDAVRASETFAFGTLKQGYYLGEGFKYTGKVHFCELPFPHAKVRENHTFLIDEDWLPEKSEKPAQHKYEAGVLHIIAGSEGLAGAGVMAAESAWAEGLGAVVLVCPRGLLPIYENNLPHIIKKPVGKRDDYFFKPVHLSEVNEAVTEKKGPVLIGSGMGRKKETVQFVNEYLSLFDGSSIIDADALWCLGQQAGWEKPAEADWILTPHPGEFSQLLEDSLDEDIDRLHLANDMAESRQITMLSKGFPVIVCTPAGERFVTSYDNRKFSRAGFGDVLAGKVGAFRAMGNTPAESCIRALIHGNKKMTKLKSSHPRYIPEPRDLI